MRKEELLFNFSLGGSILLWGVMGIYSDFQESLSIVRISSSFLNFFIAYLILTRKPLKKAGSYKAILISLPSFLFGGFLFKMSQPLTDWNLYVEIIFVIGLLFTIISFFYLGKNFSIFPSLRDISTKGPYSLVRHPGYLGESLMIFACCLISGGLHSYFIFLLFLFFIGWRINEEEELLSKCEIYKCYCSKVKWKFLPFIF